MIKNNKKFSHKTIGNKLELFFFYKNLNTGLPIWLPNGTFIYNKIKKIIKKINLKDKYNEVITPYFGNYSIYQKSGHLEKYVNNIYQILNKKKIYLKPMNCPYHGLIYNYYNNISYKKLPIKLFEFGTVFRNEKVGEINGLFRTKIFTQDDGHIFCKNNLEIKKEVNNIIKRITNIYKKFGFKKFYIQLSLRDKNSNKYIGLKSTWEKSEKLLESIIINLKIKYKKNYGEAAFYGPKIDFIIKDIIGREWQLSTIQIDYNTPKKLGLKYIDKKNTIKHPIMIHRAYLGSIERFVGILIEHTNGYLPIWLLKVQIVILPIYYKINNYADKIKKLFIKKKIRCIVDKKKNNINKKIKKYQKKHIPFLLIVGDREKKNKEVYIRQRDNIKKVLRLKFAYKYILEYIYKK